MNPPKRVLVIKWSALGDAAIASAAIEDLRRAWPDAVLHLNTLPAAARLFAEDARFERLLVIDVRARRWRWARHVEWLRAVRRERYDAVVDLQGSDHTRLLLAALLLTGHRIAHRIGLRGGFPYNVQPKLRDRRAHAWLQMQSALEAGSVPAFQTSPVLHAGDADRAAAAVLLRDSGLAGRRFALLMPGSQAGGWLKRWSASRYAALAQGLVESGEIDAVGVLGGPEEIDECRDIAQRIDAVAAGRAVHLDRVPLLQIPLLAAAARLVVANDTGTAHIAAAACVPLYVLCGPTDPLRVKPMGAHAKAVQSQGACHACYRKTCAHGESPRCLDEIAPEALLELVRSPHLPPAGLRVFDDASVMQRAGSARIRFNRAARPAR